MAGRKIDDHASFAGMPGEMALPTGNKLKTFRSAEGSGHVGTEYSDTTEMIHRDQSHGDSKIKSHRMKSGYRY